MNKYFYDLHVHSCLSPCGDDDNTPNNLAGMATLCGLNIVALTDHNTAKNCPAFFEAAKKQGIIPVAGMEVTTSEDIHAVCLFETLEGAMEYMLPGTNVRVIAVPGMADDKAVAGRLSNFFYGTDLESDMETFDLWYSKDNREFRIDVSFIAGVQIAYPSEVAYYTL